MFYDPMIAAQDRALQAFLENNTFQADMQLCLTPGASVEFLGLRGGLADSIMADFNVAVPGEKASRISISSILLDVVRDDPEMDVFSPNRRAFVTACLAAEQIQKINNKEPDLTDYLIRGVKWLFDFRPGK